MSDTPMTSAEQSLSDDKMRAEIAKLIAESSKINVETMKLQTETRWYPLLLATGLVGALSAAIAIIFKMLGL